MMGGFRKKENYHKSDEQRVAVIKHILNTSSIIDSPATEFCLLSSTDTVLHGLVVLNPHKGAYSVFLAGFL